MASESLTSSRLPRRGALLPAFPHVSLSNVPSRATIGAATLVALLGGAAVGWLAVTRGPIPTFALLVGLVWFVLALSDPRFGVWSVVGVVALLPFAVIPVHVGLTLTLLEATALGALGVWGLRLALRRDELIVRALPAGWIVLLLAVTLFALLLGTGSGYSLQTYHDYGKFVLAILLVFVVWNTTRTLDDARRLVTVILLGGGCAALVGLALYVGGPGLTLRALSRLIPYGYPSTDVVRYIEDNPAKAMRLTGTSVDPNSFGGFLAVVFVLACALAVARRRLIPRRLTLPAAGLTGLALLLTQSRGAWVGAAAGLAVLTLLRYRWLIVPGGMLALLVLALGLGENFIHRFYLGITLQDPATKLRLQEYANALGIIRAHPLFGVGFASASITLHTGVSSIYLTIGEETGLLGLAVFLLAVGSVALAGFRHWRETGESAEGDLQLALFAALLTALADGVFDHFYFNIEFAHMAALLWIICGLILALSIPPGRRAGRTRYATFDD